MKQKASTPRGFYLLVGGLIMIFFVAKISGYPGETRVIGGCFAIIGIMELLFGEYTKKK